MDLEMDLEKFKDSKDVGEILTYVRDHFEYHPSKCRKNCPKIMITTGFGAGGIVLLYFVKQVMPPGVPIYFIDTRHHFSETLKIKTTISDSWKLNLKTLYNVKSNATPRESMRCCYERKVVPIEKELEKYGIWISAIRKGETEARKNLKVIDDSDPRVEYKVSPMANWSREDVWNFIKALGLSYNSLYDQGYTSIGCEPCTKKPKKGQGIRSGRWVGTAQSGGECGIHISPNDTNLNLSNLSSKSSDDCGLSPWELGEDED